MFGLTPFNRNGVQRNNQGLVDFYHSIDNFFNDDFFMLRGFKNDTFKVDIKESEDEYFIEAEMPGIKKEDIYLEYNNDYLSIAINHKEDTHSKQDNYIHRERKVCAMQRNMYLKNGKRENIQAKLEDGILKVTIPKDKTKTQNNTVIEIK